MGGYCDLEWKFKSIGKNVRIGRNVYIRYPELVEIGDNVIIDDFSYFSTAMKIGRNVHIGPHCSCIGGASSTLYMDDFSGLAAGVRLICASDDFTRGLTGPTIPAKYRDWTQNGYIRIAKHGLVGTGCVVHPCTTINEGVAIGSMTLVRSSLEAWGVYAGNPIRKLDTRDKAGILLAEKLYLQEEG